MNSKRPKEFNYKNKTMIQIILKKVKARNILNVANDENIFILI
jgi:hypothetical protein